jgi:hypothetical protein
MQEGRRPEPRCDSIPAMIASRPWDRFLENQRDEYAQRRT